MTDAFQFDQMELVIVILHARSIFEKLIPSHEWPKDVGQPGYCVEIS
jgi:hypothetical protein